MNFVMEGYDDRFRIDAAICDMRTGKPFSDKQRYIFIQTPLFDKKTPGECVTDLDQWMYNIINMPTMETMAFTQQRGWRSTWRSTWRDSRTKRGENGDCQGNGPAGTQP